MRRDMPPKKDRGSKSETLSLRMDPKTKFILEFVARLNGQTLTTVVERAIRSSCDKVQIGDDFYGLRNWSNFWDPHEGVRTLKLIGFPLYPSTYDEDELENFARRHWEFFYTKENALSPHRAYIEILWPKIDQYRRIWAEQRNSDYWAAGRAMAADLSAAQVTPPEWPRKAQKDDIDDEIPF